MKVVRLAILGLATTSLLNCTDDTSTPDIDDDDNTEIDRGDNGPLTPPSSDAPEKITRDYLGSHVGKQIADQLGMVNQYTTARGVTHVRMEQVISGMRVHGAYVKAALNSKGQLLQVIHKLNAIPGAVAPAAINDADALRSALVEYSFGVEPALLKTRGNLSTFAKTIEMYREPTVERVVYIEGKALRQGFLVMTWSQQENQLDYTLVGGDGSIVSAERRTSNDSYNVFVEDPGKGAQTVVSGPGAGNAESPAGWLSGNQTTVNITGNNAHAYLDTDANNAPDSGGDAVTSGNFLAAVNLAAQPSTTGNKAVAVQNLFYLNNVIHDTLYRHGFDEAAGNFQTNNFGKGGAGNDPVNAEAQDGSGTDNANFATPADGSSPRMQMFLWSGSAPDSLLTVGATDYGAYSSSFGAATTASGTPGVLAVVNDGAGTTSDGCEASAPGSLTGKIAIVDRGTCNFTVKVLNAQNAGAVAAIIVNNVASSPFSPGGTERRVKIPSAMVAQSDRAALIAAAGNGGNLHKNSTPPLMIDGDLDADIVFHEYGHGLTWRMIGSMSGTFAGAIGEGASDVNAFLNTGDDRIGEYSFSDPAGIRRFPYTNYPNTYANWTAGEVHADGEIYAGAMWRVMENYLAAGHSIDVLYGDWVDGFNFTPAGPKPEQMRDGMLQSAAGSGRECLIWRGFAAQGIGVGAQGVLKKGGRSVSITESFALPAQCQ